MEVQIKCWGSLEEEAGIRAGTKIHSSSYLCVCFQFLLIGLTFALITQCYNYPVACLPPPIKLKASKGHGLNFIVDNLWRVVVHI